MDWFLSYLDDDVSEVDFREATRCFSSFIVFNWHKNCEGINYKTLHLTPNHCGCVFFVHCATCSAVVCAFLEDIESMSFPK